MKELFIEKRLGRDALGQIRKINAILDEYRAGGYKLSLRQLYYQLVSRNIIPNTERSYKNTSKLVSDARLAGLVSWDIIEDRGRVEVSNSHWDTPNDILNACAQSFRVDMWENQSTWVIVMVEKQALEGVLIPVCQRLDVPFMANKGYSSSSAMYKLGKGMSDLLEAGKDVVVIYLGDHDPSGIDMTRDIEDRLRMFTRIEERDELEGTLRVERIALNMPQIRELNPPENPAKMTDSRFHAYHSLYGESSWELDAIEPRRLATLVTSAIESEINKEQWDEDAQRQRAWRAELATLASSHKFEGQIDGTR